MKKAMFFLTVLLLSFSQYTFAECQTINEGNYSTVSGLSKGDSACYQYYVSSGNMPVFTLKHQNGQADFDLAVYSDSSMTREIGSGTSPGIASELVTLSSENSGQSLYVKVTNHSHDWGTYQLYAEQVDFGSKIGEVLAETATEAVIEWGIKALFGIDDTSNEDSQKNVGRASSAIMSMLQGKNLANTSRDLLIGEVKREMVGDGFISDFAVNYAISIIDDIYKHY
jgi:hypothetical protein